MNANRIIVVTALLASLAACAPQPRERPEWQPPPPLEESGGQAPDSIPAKSRAPAPGSKPTPSRLAERKPPPMSRAARSLLEKARAQRANGDATAAAATLERALRIEPRNALLWGELAQVREKQGQDGLAADLAQKSNALAGDFYPILRKANWRLIARVRQRVGDSAGARSALERAERVE